MVPRGIRNNNPLNIERGQPWQGLRPRQTDNRFCQFTSMEYGFRAGFKILQTYFKKRPPLNTVRLIITRWAPPGENNTEAYINFVCTHGYLQPDELLKYKDKNKICRLVWAMAEMECGQRLPFGRIENAYAMANV